MVAQGIVKDGDVVFQDELRIPEGTVVSVTPVPDSQVSPEDIPKDDPIYRLFELAGPTGIPDLSRNIDHYLYGHPKVTERDDCS